MQKPTIYLIGSLRNKNIPKIANWLRSEGFEVFDDWQAAGRPADDYWRKYELQRGHDFKQALNGYAARNVFEFDKKHLDRCDIAVMVMKAGKSACLELGYTIGKGKRGYILFDDQPKRFDAMMQFATDVFFNKEDLLVELNKLDYTPPIKATIGEYKNYFSLSSPDIQEAIDEYNSYANFSEFSKDFPILKVKKIHKRKKVVKKDSKKK